ncbi:hypothetical protein L1987_09008 [Smallanthus sonchifolius]|uniref:Uncharacterized protein n=1 Tax=Smallanthus sonchifolius TaxID=185202 RepID=A0ACB9JNV1_9ASTR|nr:hypothetical protein L1987_09008 [Smallanthus sonchifolius]
MRPRNKLSPISHPHHRVCTILEHAKPGTQLKGFKQSRIGAKEQAAAAYPVAACTQSQPSSWSYRYHVARLKGGVIKHQMEQVPKPRLRSSPGKESLSRHTKQSRPEIH